jgi:predicted PurR-regulated permease PerM
MKSDSSPTAPSAPDPARDQGQAPPQKPRRLATGDLPSVGKLSSNYSLRRLAAFFFISGGVVFSLLIIGQVMSFVGTFGGIITMCFLAWLLAFVVSPLVDEAVTRLRISRSLAIGLVYAGVIVVLVGLIAVAASIGVSQAQSLANRFDEATATISASLASFQAQFGISTSTIDLAALFAQAESRIVPEAKAALIANSGAIAANVVSIFTTLSIVLVLSVFIVSDASGLQAKWRRVMPNRFESQLDLFDRSVGRAFRGFLWLQVVLIVIQVALTAAVGLVFGLPYLFLICFFAALCMPIPFVGSALALFPPIFVAAAFAPGALLPVAVVVFFGQMSIMHYAVPRIMKKTSGVHPLITIISVLVGAQVAGVWGAIFGLPIAAVISILVNYTINLQAISEVEGMDLAEVAAAIRAADPEATPEEVMAEAANQAEAIYAAQREDRAGPQGSATGGAPMAAPTERGRLPGGDDEDLEVTRQ